MKKGSFYNNVLSVVPIISGILTQENIMFVLGFISFLISIFYSIINVVIALKNNDLKSAQQELLEIQEKIEEVKRNE